MALVGFPPVMNNDTTVLILGSFPGVASLAAAQYYAHPRNQFWKLLETLLQEPLTTLPYELRLERIQAHGFGVWDVLAQCERTGSLDTAIRNPIPNGLTSLPTLAPQLQKIGLNGKRAGRFAPMLSSAGYQTLTLPSSSPAHAALSFEQKLEIWRGLL